MSTHAEPLEADLQRYYGLDLLDFYRPGSRLSVRKLSVLISYLPPESATATAIRRATPPGGEGSGSDHDPADAPWSLVELLLASVIDELRWSRYEFRQANTKDAGSPPEQVPRPGVKGKKRGPLTADQRMMLDPRMRGEWDG